MGFNAAIRLEKNYCKYKFLPEQNSNIRPSRLNNNIKDLPTEFLRKVDYMPNEALFISQENITLSKNLRFVSPCKC